ncbi:hypothetical protein [Phocaeicola plebeius]|uniref:hypothetical protein n=1 Tax=Phocaeicola plebeius TaxID=310297 RepID=UPI003F81FC8A
MKKIMFNDKYGLTKAVLEGRKTQTRRIITHPKTFHGKDVCGFYVCKRASDGVVTDVCMYDEDESFIDEGQILPKYEIGEIVAVAQNYTACGGFMDDGTPRWDYISCIVGSKNRGWSNKMFVKPELMPHQIKITNVRIERLQDISDDDCLAEGVELNTRQYKYDGTKYYCVRGLGHWRSFGCDNYKSPREAYAALIDKVGKKGDWESNPYVFVYDFELIK